MPELAEVEHARRVLDQRTRGRRVVEAWCAEDSIVVDGTSPEAVVAALRGRRIGGTGRRGKHLWIEPEGGPAVMLHLGMTGAIRTPGDAPIQLETAGATSDQSWPPRFCKLHFSLDDGGQVGFVNARRLGRIRLRKDPLAEPPISTLGFDPLLDLPDPRSFAAAVTRRKATIKGLLLDQKFAAGVGNWIADEVLYQARVRPDRRADSLNADEIEALRAALEHVVHTAVAADARKDRFPSDWLFHRRWGKQEGVTTMDGHAIRHDAVAGRTTAWVPDLQR